MPIAAFNVRLPYIPNIGFLSPIYEYTPWQSPWGHLLFRCFSLQPRLAGQGFWFFWEILQNAYSS
jgi:hypothetical protein